MEITETLPKKCCRHCSCTDCKKKRRVGEEKRKYLVMEYIKEQKVCCEDCGWNKVPRLLEFHHIKKEKNNKKPIKCRSIKRVKEELEKGVFLCPTCHSLRHYDRVLDRVDYTNENFR